MKKLLSLIFILGLCLLGLFACENSKVTYKDPATGEEKELKIETTTNEQEVSDSLYAVALSEQPVKEVSAASATVEFKADLTGKDEKGVDQKVKVEGKLEINESFDKNAKFETTADVIKALAFSAKLEAKGTLPKEDGTTESFAKSTVELFLEEGVLYAKVALDAKLAAYIADNAGEYGAMVQLVNEKTLKIDLNTMAPAEKLTEEQKADLDAVLKGESQKTLKQLLEENGAKLEDLKAELDAVVKELGLTITKVKGGEVTYSADVSKKAFDNENPKSKLTVDVTVNVAEVSFVGASVKAELNEDEVKGTASLTLEVNYKASVAKISSADKEKAVDFMSLMGGGRM